MSLDCLTIMIFFPKMVLKMITAAACEGPGAQVCGSGTKSSSLSSLYFQSCSRQIVSPAEKLTVLQLIGLEKYENLRTT